MSLSVRVPLRVEQEIAEYCVTHRVSKSEVVKRALDQFLTSQSGQPSPYELGRTGFGADTVHSGDIARNTKKLLRERFRVKNRR